MAEERIEEYVPREVFDIQLQHINDRCSSEEKISELRFSSFQTSMERKFESLENRVDKKISGLENKIDGVESELKGDIKALDEKIDGVKSELTAKIEGLDKSIESLDKNQNKWFAIFGLALTFITIAIPFITIMAQKFFLN